MTSIPSPRLVLTDLINQITSLHSKSQPPTAVPTPKFHTDPESAENPLKSLPEAAHELIVVLDSLLPSGISPALDFLDRGLVTRYSLKIESDDETRLDTGDAMSPDKSKEPDPPTRNRSSYVYHVQSSQPRARKPPKSKSSPPRTYCVRTKAWYCSCDAFTHSAFADEPKPVSIGGVNSDLGARGARRLWKQEEEDRIWRHMNEHGWVWGGRMLGAGSPPVCMHLVACVLAEWCGGLFMPYVREVFLTMDEMLELGVGHRMGSQE